MLSSRISQRRTSPKSKGCSRTTDSIIWISRDCVCRRLRASPSQHAVSTPTITPALVLIVFNATQVLLWRNLKGLVNYLVCYRPLMSFQYLPLLIDKVEKICEDNGL